MSGKSLVVVLDVAMEMCGWQDGVLVPKYKLWNRFGFRDDWNSNV